MKKSKDTTEAKVYKGSEMPETEWMSTGIPKLDKQLGGGLPLGRMITIAGKESSGKTSLCLYIIGKAQEMGIRCAFVDVERSFVPKHAELMGVDLKKLDVVIPDYAEQAVEKIEELVLGGIKLVVVDSLAALSVRAEGEAAYEGAQISLLARLMGRVTRKTNPIVSDKKSVVVWINQLRNKVMTYGHEDPYYEPGGEAMKFFRAIGLRLSPKGRLENEGKLVGIRVVCKVIKNKVSEPQLPIDFDLHFASGFSGELDPFEEAIERGEVERRGNSYFIGEEKLATGKEEAKKVYGERSDN